MSRHDQPPFSTLMNGRNAMTIISVDVEQPRSRVRLRDRFRPARAPGASLSRASARPVLSLGKATHEVDEFDAEVWQLCDGGRTVGEIARDIFGSGDPRP